MMFEDWLEEFLEALAESGLHPGQARKYMPGGEYEQDARRYWSAGTTPDNAVRKELLG